ncbi:MAG: gamma-glutamyltransferase [Gammaproteobacteria bacterium]|nr:gamma-glutamyltransferase [Gammaproteobacteria bacterium]
MRKTLFVLVLLFSIPAAAERPSGAAVATAHPLASEAGLRILAAGGNAFDAAVAVSAALAVVEPQSSGLGGGGFWLIHRAGDGFETMIDGRERAPSAARADMYLDDKGEVIPGRSMDGPLAAGIPGTPAALVHLAQNYGRFPLAESLAPAIGYAREGFPVTPLYQRLARFRLDALKTSPAAARIFLRDGAVPELGHTIRQPDLARTLEALARHGAEGFYRGPVAKRLVTAVREAGGIWTLDDLADYRVVERPPLRGRYGGFTVTAAAPPSSGGVALITMLNILEDYDLAALPPARRSHVIIEAMRRAYRDRAQHLGDPDHVEVPTRQLIDKAHAARLRADIALDRATPSTPRTDAQEPEGTDTTHFSILDGDGNYVAATLSINYPFGSGFVAEGTGVLLNDEMDDFSAKPGAANAYGLVGNDANAIAPGKRMLSSMSPTFVTGPDRVAVLGTPGGSRIITMVLLGILEMADGKDPQAWVARPRFHHQYLPDKVFAEPDAFDEGVAAELRRLGHTLEVTSQPWGNMQALLWDRKTGRVSAASDPRGEGMSFPGAAGMPVLQQVPALNAAP